MNVSQLYAEIGRLCNDPNNTRWPVATLLIRLNLAQNDVQIKTSAVKTVEQIALVAGTAKYTSANTNILDILRATLTDTAANITELKEYTLSELYYRRPNWPNEAAGQPDCFFFDYTLDQFTLVAPPNSTFAGANAFTITEVLTPTVLALTTDVPFGANNQMIPYHLALAYWVVAQNLLDNNDTESLQKAQTYRTGNLDHPGEYEKILIEINQLFDTPTDIKARILWKPQGGRLGGWPVSKSTPLG